MVAPLRGSFDSETGRRRTKVDDSSSDLSLEISACNAAIEPHVSSFKTAVFLICLAR